MADGRTAEGGQPGAQFRQRGVGFLAQTGSHLLPGPGIQVRGGARAGPGRGGKAATEPVVRWRCSSFSTNETETLNWAATAGTVRPGWAQVAATRVRKSSEYAFIPRKYAQTHKQS